MGLLTALHHAGGKSGGEIVVSQFQAKQMSMAEVSNQVLKYPYLRKKGTNMILPWTEFLSKNRDFEPIGMKEALEFVKAKEDEDLMRASAAKVDQPVFDNAREAIDYHSGKSEVVPDKSDANVAAVREIAKEDVVEAPAVDPAPVADQVVVDRKLIENREREQRIADFLIWTESVEKQDAPWLPKVSDETKKVVEAMPRKALVVTARNLKCSIRYSWTDDMFRTAILRKMEEMGKKTKEQDEKDGKKKIESATVALGYEVPG